MDGYGRPQYGGYAPHNGAGGGYPPRSDHGWSQSPRRGRGGYRGGGGGGGGGGAYYQQQAGAPPPQSREQKEENRIRHIRGQLFKLGEDKDFHPPSDLLKMARWVQERSKEGSEHITAAFRVMVTEQPHKTPLIAALIGFLCLSNQPQASTAKSDSMDDEAMDSDSLGITIVKDLVKAFRSYLDARLWRNTRLSLHLFAALVPLYIISPSALRNILTSFAAVLDEPGVEVARADRASLCIIETLCRAGQDLLSDGDHAQSELDSLVERVVSYDAARKVEVDLARPTHDIEAIWLEGFPDAVAALEMLRVNGYQKPAFLPSPLDLLPAAISPSATSVPEEKRIVSLPDVLVPPDEDDQADGFDVAYVQLGQNQVKKRKIDTGKGELEEKKAAVGPDRVGLQPRWFPGTAVPARATPSSLVLRAILADMIDLYEVNRKDAAKVVLELPMWLRRGTFGGKVSSELGLFGEADDQWWSKDSEDIQEAVQGNWSLDDLIVETLIATALVLPVAPRNPLYYTALLREIVCLTPGTVAPSLGRTIRSFYDAMATGNVDVEAVHRFADWFAIHLSNFNFGWAWKEWIPDTQLVSNHPKKAFMRRTVELEIRLAYYDRIKQTLPAEIQETSSIVPQSEPLPVFTYADETHPYHGQASRLIMSIKAKAAADVIMADFESFKSLIFDSSNSTVPSGAGGEEEGGVNSQHEAELAVRDLTIQCVLQVGSRSFSHFLNIVERYHTLLRQLSRTPRMRIAILAGSARFWRQSAQWTQIVTDKLLQYRIVETADVVDFIFHPPVDEPAPILVGKDADAAALRDWSTFSWWNILNLTLEKVNGRVDQLQKRLVDIQRQEAEEAERREAALVAGFDANKPDEQEPPVTETKLPLFPTSATLPSRPDESTSLTSAADGMSGVTGSNTTAAATVATAAKVSSAEALANLEAIKSEQRKVLLNTISGFRTVLTAAVVAGSSAQEPETAQWAVWWIRGWYTQFCRAFNKQLREIHQLALSNCFPPETVTQSEPAWLKDVLQRAINLINE